MEPAYVVRQDPKTKEPKKVKRTWEPHILSSADLALEWVVKAMPQFIYVPQELAESEGMTPSEAKRLSRVA